VSALLEAGGGTVAVMSTTRDWPADLAASGPERDEALVALRDLLLRAARFELGRRHNQLWHLGAQDLEDLAEQSADDALVAVLAKLGSFRGQSRFTTWAYKFALLEASVTARRRAWSGRDLPLTEEGWERLEGTAVAPDTAAGTRELLSAIGDAIATELTPHQREVLVALAVNDVPIDVLAERLDTTRGALYKTLHDARRKLRAALGRRGLGPEGGPTT
jgi:RNA polymerase sigma-70 factor (ECF subfamily)